jgi:hypothetical protein
MAEVNWEEHTDEEVIRACKTAPRIFGPWEEWDPLYGGRSYAWSRHELHPGPSWKSGGRVSVQRNTGCPGYTVYWWDGVERSESFASPEEAKACGDAWLNEAGHRIRHAPTPQSSEERKP